MAKKNKVNKDINLLPQEEFAASTLGRTLKWLLSTFRMIVISTEMVVMIAFLSRFWLDSQNNDLTDSISQERIVVGSYKDVETKFRLTQQKLDTFSKTIASPQMNTVVAKLAPAIPNTVSLQSLTLKGNTLQLEVQAPSEEDGQQLIANLQGSKSFQNTKLVSAQLKDAQTSFTLDTSYFNQTNGN